MTRIFNFVCGMDRIFDSHACVRSKKKEARSSFRIFFVQTRKKKTRLIRLIRKEEIDDSVIKQFQEYIFRGSSTRRVLRA